MKNKNYFLNANFETTPMKEVHRFLENEGWYFKVIKTAGKIRINMYELEEDYDFWHDLACSARADTFEQALYLCVTYIKEQYAKKN